MTGRTKRLNVIVSSDLHTAFKAATAAQGKEMSEVLLRFIEDYVRKYNERAQPPKRGGQ